MLRVQVTCYCQGSLAQVLNKLKFVGHFSPHFLDNTEGGIVGSASHKDYFVGWITLAKKRGNIFLEALLYSAKRCDHRNKRCVIQYRKRDFSPYVRHKTQTTAKRKNAEP